MKPGKIDLDIFQRSTFRKQLVWKINKEIVNLTGYTARMHILPSIESESEILPLTTENDRIVITPSEGKIELTISAADTSALSFSTAYYYLELVDGAEVTRLCQGKVTLHK